MPYGPRDAVQTPQPRGTQPRVPVSPPVPPRSVPPGAGAAARRRRGATHAALGPASGSWWGGASPRARAEVS